MVLRGERISNDPDLLDNIQVWVENNYDTQIFIQLMVELLLMFENISKA